MRRALIAILFWAVPTAEAQTRGLQPPVSLYESAMPEKPQEELRQLRKDGDGVMWIESRACFAELKTLVEEKREPASDFKSSKTKAWRDSIEASV